MARKFFGIFLFCFLCLGLPACGEIRLNEIMASNGIFENGESYDWIEIMNTGSEPASLSGVTIAITKKDETFSHTFSEEKSLAPGERAILHFIGFDPPPAKGNLLTLPFELPRKGAELALLRGNQPLDSLTYPEQWGNIAFGRVGDGDAWAFLGDGTPGLPNPSIGYEGRAAAPFFSLTGGFLPSPAALTLMGPEGGEIHFTLDGREPTENSPLYQGSLPLDRGIYTIRARAFEKGLLPSETVSQTYFMDFASSVPIVSLMTDEKYLFDDATGILVPGRGSTKNYYKDWEYPIHMEYYTESGEQQLSQGCTFRVTGATSRKYGQKTLSLFARPAYGKKRFSFAPFPAAPDQTRFKALTLRAAGTESFLTRFRDCLLASRARDLGILYQEGRPVLVYLNGEYWGHYNLRERVNKHMIARFEGIEDEFLIDTMTIIKGRGEVQQGTRDEWDQLIRFCKEKDLNEEGNLDWLSARLDIDNYFTHAAIQMVIGNKDIGNVRYYKIPGGKWKCALYDLDAGMGNLEQGPIRYYNKTPKEDSQLFYHEPFAALIRVPEMKDRFFTILGQVLLRYLPEDLSREIDAWEEALSPLMPDQMKRWPKSSPKSLSVWQYEIRELRSICNQRPRKVVDMACSVYHLSSAQREKYFGDFLSALNP